ncbi:hypothetical protein JQ594_27070 [Bradyrhizobium manausense]|uniref:hypothetical protein n=2 Tax=Bradyrhizobium manausense TaxID=989370 RepID=UPI001BA94901|nr:hypothetical protein [Bradyrhizobium manausense]MBR0689606.1 hypothetical protein [Bradyrhizobium manausense]
MRHLLPPLGGENAFCVFANFSFISRGMVMSIRLASALATGAVLLSMTPGHAAATRFGTYYDETAATASCVGLSTCSMSFSQLPSDKLLLVRKVMCSITTNQSRPTHAYFKVATGPYNANPLTRHLMLPLPAAPTADVDGFYHASIDVDPNWLIGQARYPYLDITMAVAQSTTIDCTLRGELVDPNQ